MLWLGVLGRRKLAALETRCEALEKTLEELRKGFTALDLEMTDQVDRLTGIAKRMQGRRGGRPPGQQNGHAEPDTDGTTSEQLTFSRHVL